MNAASHSLFLLKLVLLMADVTIRATVLLALTAIIAILSCRASASFRHLVWALGLGCVLMLPLLSYSLPHWHMAVRTPVTHERQAAVKAPPALTSPFSSGSGVASAKAAPEGSPLSAPSTAALHVNNRSARTYPPLTPLTPTQTSAGISWTEWAVLVWGVGVLLMLTRIGRGVACLRTIAVTSTQASDTSTAQMKAAREAMRVSQPVTLLTASAAARVPVPITWGILRPVIVIPDAAAAWPADKLRAALLHELAHVRRGDWLLLTLAHLTCAFHWFNPLVWLAARRMRAESEAACDDLVLSAGLPASDYARHLLDVALGARDSRLIGSEAVAMAQTPRIEGRLRAVLAQSLSRRPVTPKMAASLIAVTFLLSLPLAALQIEASSQSSAKEDNISAADMTQNVLGGGTVSLIGVSYNPSAHRTWWGKDGLLLPNNPKARGEGTISDLHALQGQQAREFRIEVEGTEAGDDIVLEVPLAFSTTETAIEPISLTARRSRTFFHLASLLPATASTCTVRVGVASQPWAKLASVDDLSSTQSGSAMSGGAAMDGASVGMTPFSVEFSPPSLINGRAAFTVSDNVTQHATRLVAVDVRGRTVVSEVSSDVTGGATRQRTVVFPTLRLKDIKSVEFQVRPYQWMEFRNIPLQPKSIAAEHAAARPQDDSAQSLVALGQQLQQKGQPRDGIPAFRRAVQFDPNDAEAQYQLAQALYQVNWKRTGNSTESLDTPPAVLDEAILHMRKAILLRPNDPHWPSTLGTYFENRGRNAEAATYYRRALHLLGPAPYMSVLHRISADGSGKAGEVYDNQWALGNALLKTGQYGEAAIHYREALRYNPQAAWVLLGYGDALHGSRRNAEARAAWKKLLAIQPPNPYYQRMARERLARQ